MNPILIRLLAIILCLIVPVDTKAAEERVFRSDKISSHLFCDIVQDGRGYIWIATEYGLNRYDGSRFIQYYADGKDGSISSNFVRCMAIDRNGDLLVACDNSLLLYDDIHDTFKAINDEDGRAVHLHSIAVSPRQTLMLDNRGCIYSYSDGELRKCDGFCSDIDQPKSVREIFIDDKNNVWIGTEYNGVFRFDQNGKRMCHFDNPLIMAENINAFETSADGTVFIAASTRLWRHNRVCDTLEEIVHDEDFSSIRDIVMDDDDVPVIGTYGRGLYYIDENDRWRPLSDRMSISRLLQKSNVTTLFRDRDGIYWAGCFNEGLVEIIDADSPFETFDASSLTGGTERSVTMIYNDSKGNLWIGQEHNGILRVNQNGDVTGHYCKGRTPLSMAEDSDGMLHVGFYDYTVARIDPKSGKTYYDDRLGYVRVRSIVEAPDGSIWYGMFNLGLARRGVDDSISYIRDIPQTAINRMYIDSDSMLWLAHYNGVDCIDPATGNVVPLPECQPVKQSIAYAIAERKGVMYIGTSVGLFAYDKGKKRWTHYGSDDGLSSDFVCGIVEDKAGNLWLSTYRGLNLFSPDEDKFTAYFVGNGLKNSNYNRSLYSEDTHGNIFFANDHSVVAIKPDNMADDAPEREIVLTRMLIHHNSTDHTADADYESDKPIEEVRDFTLTHSQDVFSMYFTTLDFTDSENMQLQYRLNGSERWLTTEPGDTKIQFTRLPAGRWTLQVRAVNHGKTSGISEYHIRILPPWYGSWWAMCIYALLFIALVIWAFRMWLRHQTEANNEAKLRFFIDLAHEFRSPITLMLSPLDKLLKKDNDPDTSRALRNIYRNASRMMQLLNQILDIRKIDKGQMKIECRPTDIVPFTREVCHVFDYEADKRKCKLTFTSTVDSLEVWIDRDHFDKILYNLLSNAFKYVPDGGSIDVALMTDPTPRAGFPEGAVRISVTDSGPGIKESQMKQIFDRFYQISPRSREGASGYGLGLNLSRQLVELHHGTIEVENRTDGPTGARFIVSLPLGNNHLSASQQLAGRDDAIGTPVHALRPVMPANKEPLKYVPKKTAYHVVVVDDDDEMRSYLETELHSFCYVKTFADAVEALKYMQTEPVDLVVTDVVMPGMDGYELLHRIKTNSSTSAVPVILLTSNNDADDRIKGLRKGADAYIVKPFMIDELLVRINGLISNRKLMKGKFSGAQEQTGRVDKVTMRDVDDELMATIMKILNANVDNPALNVEMLSNEVGISRAQLHRRVKEITGISCGEFIRNFRLKHAADLLSGSGNVYVAQVAYACGFSNATNFSTTFKKHFGMSPSEYAAANRK